MIGKFILAGILVGYFAVAITVLIVRTDERYGMSKYTPDQLLDKLEKKKHVTKDRKYAAHQWPTD